MARIDESATEPASPQLTEFQGPHANESEFGRPQAELANIGASLGDKLIHLQNAQDVATGSADMGALLDKTQEGIVQSNDYKGYTGTMDHAVSTLTDSINSNYSGPARTELLNRLAAQKIARYQDLDHWAYQGTIATGKQHMDDIETQTLQNLVGASPAMRQLSINSYLQDVDAQTGTLYRPDEAIERKRAFLNSADYGPAFYEVANTPQTALAKLKDPQQYGNLTETQRSQLIIDATRMAKQQQEAAESGLSARTSDVLQEVATTGVITRVPSILSAWKNLGDPDKFAAVQDSVNVAESYNDTRQKMLTMPLDKLHDEVESFNPGGVDEISGQKKQPGTGATLNGVKDFGNQQKLYQNLQNLENYIKTTAKTDAPKLSWNTASQGLDPSTQLGSIIAGSYRKLQDIGVVRDADNTTLDPLPKDIAQQYADNLKTMPAQDRMIAQRNLDSSAGPYADAVNRQLTKLMPPSFVFGSSVADGTMKSLIAEDNISIDKLKGDIEAGGKGNFAALQLATKQQFDGVAATLPGNPGQTSAMYQSYLKHAASLQLQGVADPATKAFTEMFGDPTRGFYYRGTWRVPQGVDFDSVNDYGKKVISETKGFQGSPDTETMRSSLAASNNWVFHEGTDKVAGSGVYYLRDAGGQQINDQAGKPIKFTVAQARNYKPLADAAALDTRKRDQEIIDQMKSKQGGTP